MAYSAWSVIAGEQPTAAKWNILGTNDASFNDGTGFNDSIVLPKHLLTGTGSTWATSSWSPTYANITIGNGTVTARYVQTGKWVYAEWFFVFGSTSSMTASPPTVSLPVAANSRYASTPAGHFPIGHGFVTDAGIAIYHCTPNILTSTTTFTLYTMNAAGTYLTGTPVTSTIPTTWGTGDGFGAAIFYEAA